MHALVLKPNVFVFTKGPLGAKTAFDSGLVPREGQRGLTVFASNFLEKRKLMATELFRSFVLIGPSNRSEKSDICQPV